MGNQNSDEINGRPDGKGVVAGKDVSESVIVTGDGNVVNVGRQKKREVNSPKTQRTRHKKGKKSGMNATIVGALITVVGVISAALLSSPIIERLLFPTSVPTSTPTVFLSDAPSLPQATVASETPTTSPTALLTVLPVDTLTPETEPTITVSPSVAPGEKMAVVFFVNPSEGKAPLKVNFNARESYVIFADGTRGVCGGTRLCLYTFKIQLEGQLVTSDQNRDGVFSYKLERRGRYTASVTVCRGETCGANGVTINVR